MKFNDVNTYDSHKVYARIADSPDVPKIKLKHSTQGILFLPDHVHVEYNRSDGGKWEITRASVSGKRVLKSGTLSENSSHRNDYYYPLGLRQSDMPEFLWEFAQENMPGDNQ